MQWKAFSSEIMKNRSVAESTWDARYILPKRHCETAASRRKNERLKRRRPLLQFGWPQESLHQPHENGRYRREVNKVIIEVAVSSSRQLFNERDPGPFRQRDLD